MFYENLYKILGSLFYYATASNGKVHTAEKEKLHQVVQSSWKPLEESADEFGTDLANQIEFSFDFEEAESITPKGLDDFELFYKHNRSGFTPVIKKNILDTLHAIALAYHGENKKEEALFHRIKDLLK